MTSTKEIMQPDITLHCCTIETCNNEIAIHFCMASAWVSCKEAIFTIAVLVHVCNKTQQIASNQ